MPSSASSAIVVRGVGVVVARGDDVDALAVVRAAVGGAFEAALQEAAEQAGRAGQRRAVGQHVGEQLSHCGTTAATAYSLSTLARSAVPRRVRERGVVEQRDDRGGNCGRVFVRHEQAAHPVDDLLVRSRCRAWR